MFNSMRFHKHWLSLLGVPLFLVCVFGLASVPPACAQTRSSYQSEIDSLNHRIADLESAVESLQKSVLSNSYSLLGKQDANSGVMLRTDSQGFQILNAGVGNFLVSVKSVKPYLTGYEVTIDVGNPMDARVSDASFALQWGPERTKGTSITSWYDKLQTKDKSMTTPLYAGTWTPVTFILTPAKASDIGYLYLTMSARQVQLSQMPDSSD